MPILLLYSPDDALRADLEARLAEQTTPSWTLLRLESTEELRDCMDTLGDIRVIVTDLRHRDPPEGLGRPQLGLCDAATAPPQGMPCLALPLRSVELHSLLNCLTSSETRLQPEEAFQHRRQLVLGRFQSGIAHDLNNRLTTLAGYLILLPELLPDEKDMLSDMARAAEEASDLIRLIETFTHRDPYPPHEVDLTGILRFVKSLAGRIVGRDGHLQWNLPHTPLPLRGDEATLETLFLTILSWFSAPRAEITVTASRDADDVLLEIRGASRPPPGLDTEAGREEAEALSRLVSPTGGRLEIHDDTVRCRFPALDSAQT